MPFVNIRTIAGLLDGPRKRLLADRIADLLVEVEGGGDPAFRDKVWVLVEEHPPEHWTVGLAQPDAAKVAAFVARRDGPA